MYGSIVQRGVWRRSELREVLDTSPHDRSRRIMSPCPSGFGWREAPFYRATRSDNCRRSRNGAACRRPYVVCWVAEHHAGEPVSNTRRPPGRNAGGLGDPPVRVAPDRGPVLADREVEALVGERRTLGVCVHEREVQPELLLERPGRRELARRVVETDHACAGASATPRRRRSRSRVRSRPALKRLAIGGSLTRDSLSPRPVPPKPTLLVLARPSSGHPRPTESRFTRT